MRKPDAHHFYVLLAFTLVLAMGRVETMEKAQAKETLTAQLLFLGPHQPQLSLDWVEKQLAAKGFSRESYRIEPSTLSPGPGRHQIASSDLELIKWVNRMRAFLSGNSKLPYVKLQLQLPLNSPKKQGPKGCVIRDPHRVWPDLTWEDLVVTVENFDRKEIKECLVQNRPADLYKNLTYPEIRNKFFGAAGYLKKAEFPQLTEDREFISFLMEKGFYVIQSHHEGAVAVEP